MSKEGRPSEPGKENHKITNKEYLAFINTKSINPMYPEEFNAALEQIKLTDKTKEDQAKRFLWLLYKTGRRPAEILPIKSNNLTDKRIIDKESNKGIHIIELEIPTLKKGNTSQLPLPYEDFKEFYTWAKNKLPGEYLFNLWIPTKTTRTQKYNTKSGPKEKTVKYYTNLVTKLGKYFRFPIYMFRHNRFTLMSESGATAKLLMQAKGSKDERSVYPYLGYSSKTKIRLSKYYK